jgi:ABC-type branched-subunit amino acid transport system substrate-binding protein
MFDRRQFLAGASAAGLIAMAGRARAENAPGVTDKEIKIGQTMPYSGPASAYGVIGKTEAAYFKMINEQGGVNGRMINLVSLDDAYSPPKTVEQARRLVEQEQVAFLFNTLGTAPNLAIRDYCNQNKVPQLFVSTGASVFSDPEHFKYTVGYNPNYRTEARIYAKHILSTKPQAKIAVLFQNDGFGKDYLAGLKDVLAGEHAEMIVKEASYETSEPTIDSQVVTLTSTAADVLVIAATPKFAAQSIRKVHELGWKPMTFLSNISIWISTVMEPAGLDAGIGVLSSSYIKDPDDPAWKDDPGVKGWRAFMAQWIPEGDTRDAYYVNAYNTAMVLEAVLTACRDDLSTENILRQAFGISGLELPMLLPGIRINTSPTDHAPVKQMQFIRFTGTQWERFGELLTAD